MAAIKHFLGYSFPFVLLIGISGWFNNFDTSLRELVKVTGFSGIGLVAIIFLVGSLSKYLPFMNHLKIFRKMWGITSFFMILAHVLLALHVRYHWDFALAFSPTRNKYWLGFIFGLASFSYFGFMALISNKWSMQKMGQAWKKWQTFGYVALFLALMHFIILETRNGEFSVPSTLGKIIFILVVAALVNRLYVFLWAYFTRPKVAETPAVSSTEPTPPPTDSTPVQ